MNIYFITLLAVGGAGQPVPISAWHYLWQDGLVSVGRFIADYFRHFQSGGDPF
jgi:hypothetical protein